jgi:hypothetical protein
MPAFLHHQPESTSLRDSRYHPSTPKLATTPINAGVTHPADDEPLAVGRPTNYNFHQLTLPLVLQEI